MKIKTSELIDGPLDWAVLEALKPDLKHPERAGVHTFGPLFGKGYKYPSWGSTKYAPSTNWAEAGPLIERERMTVEHFEDGNHHPSGGAWLATHIRRPYFNEETGPTLLVAAMRCFVASKLGDEVDIPEELL